jgi:hypothetical protein
MLRAMTPLLFLAACASGGANTPSPTPALNEEFTLAPGQMASVTGTNVRLTFDRVSEDSRCPMDVNCIWEGDAVVVLKVKVEAEEATREVHTQGGASRSRKAPVGAYMVTLVRLEPAPQSTAAIEPSAYRVTLLVGASDGSGDAALTVAPARH